MVTLGLPDNFLDGIEETGGEDVFSPNQQPGTVFGDFLASRSGFAGDRVFSPSKGGDRSLNRTPPRFNLVPKTAKRAPATTTNIKAKLVGNRGRDPAPRPECFRFAPQNIGRRARTHEGKFDSLLTKIESENPSSNFPEAMSSSFKTCFGPHGEIYKPAGTLSNENNTTLMSVSRIIDLSGKSLGSGATLAPSASPNTSSPSYQRKLESSLNFCRSLLETIENHTKRNVPASDGTGLKSTILSTSGKNRGGVSGFFSQFAGGRSWAAQDAQEVAPYGQSSAHPFEEQQNYFDSMDALLDDVIGVAGRFGSDFDIETLELVKAIKNKTVNKWLSNAIVSNSSSSTASPNGNSLGASSPGGRRNLYKSETDTVLEKVLANLQANRTQAAVEHLFQLQGYDRLMSIITSGNNNQGLLQKQIEEWKTVADLMHPTVWKIYCLLAGKLDEIIECDAGWKSVVGMYCWYNKDEKQSNKGNGVQNQFGGNNCGSNPKGKRMQKLQASMKEYESKFPHVPDLQYSLLRLAVDQNSDLTCEISSVELLWTVLLLLGQKRIGNYNGLFTRVTEQFVFELEERGELAWATFVATFLPVGKSKVVRGLVDRNPKTLPVRTLRKWNIPEAWILSSLHFHAMANQDYIVAATLAEKMIKEAEKLGENRMDLVFHLAHIICLKLFPVVMHSHTDRVDYTTLVVLMDGQYCQLCEFMRQKLEFCSSKLSVPDYRFAFETCGRTQKEFLDQYKEFSESDHVGRTPFQVPLNHFYDLDLNTSNYPDSVVVSHLESVNAGVDNYFHKRHNLKEMTC